MRFCLLLDKLKHISHEEFERLNWVLVTSSNVLTQLFLSISVNNDMII